MIFDLLYQNNNIKCEKEMKQSPTDYLWDFKSMEQIQIFLVYHEGYITKDPNENSVYKCIYMCSFGIRAIFQLDIMENKLEIM